MPDIPNGVEAPLPTEQQKAVEQPASVEVSAIEADESVRETLAETEDNILHAEQKPELEVAEESVPVACATAAQPVSKDEVTIEVEKVLEEGLGPFYASLPDSAKPLFKQRGEEASREISEMVRNFHVQARRVLQLIYVWLKTIPGVNKFFLEQEAKIKTDRIIALEEARRQETLEVKQ